MFVKCSIKGIMNGVEVIFLKIMEKGFNAICTYLM